jgi:hypothetical protein
VSNLSRIHGSCSLFFLPQYSKAATKESAAYLAERILQKQFLDNEPPFPLKQQGNYQKGDFEDKLFNVYQLRAWCQRLNTLADNVKSKEQMIYVLVQEGNGETTKVGTVGRVVELELLGMMTKGLPFAFQFAKRIPDRKKCESCEQEITSTEAASATLTSCGHWHHPTCLKKHSSCCQSCQIRMDELIIEIWIRWSKSVDATVAAASSAANNAVDEDPDINGGEGDEDGDDGDDDEDGDENEEDDGNDEETEMTDEEGKLLIEAMNEKRGLLRNSLKSTLDQKNENKGSK